MNIDQDIKQYMNYNIIQRGLFIGAFISDLHFPVNNIEPIQQYKILNEQFLDKIVLMPKLDMVGILGDIFDHKVLASSDAVLYASMFIGRLVDICRQKNTTLLILQGTLSHDANQLKLFYHYMDDPSIVDVRIVTSLKFEIIKGCRILCIPELYNLDNNVYLHYLYGSGFYDLAVMHGTFKGAVYGDNSGQSRLFTINDFNNCRGPIISGHVHKPNCYNDYFYYCGSPYAWGFDDDHNKGFILLSYNLDTRLHYVDWENIKSFKYKTIHIDDIKNNDPQYMIAYIDRIKQEQGIDFIRIIFGNINKTERLILSNNYRDNKYVKLQFPETEDQIHAKQRASEQNDEYKQYWFLTDNKLSDEEKFCMYVNLLKNDETYITVDELKQILYGEL